MDKKQYDKDYYIKNKSKRLESIKVYYQNNKEIIKARSKKYYDDNKDRLRSKWNENSKRQYFLYKDEKLLWQKEHHKKRRIDFLNKLGLCKCSMCGFDDWRALQIDHVKGGGTQERRLYNGTVTRKIQQELIDKNPENYQVLCANCNWIKRYDNKETGKKFKIL